ncbi:MAG: acyl--CoA ligase [Acidimicrobiia bacterium]|nr:acyl--CoA ligase [Acidimicrobiia bacterium]
MSFDSAVAELIKPGGGFTIVETEVAGRSTKVFENTPPSFRALWDLLRFKDPDEVFIVFEDEEWTFARLLAEIDGIAALLVGRYGVQPGDRVGIAMRNYPEWVAAFAAITSVGAIAVCFNAWWTTEELDYGLEDSGVKVVLADDERLERLQPLLAERQLSVLAVRTDGDLPDGVDRLSEVIDRTAAMPEVAIDADDDAMILYTSGTTGHPKGVVSTHRAVLTALMAYACRSIAQALASAPGPDDPPAEPHPYPTSFILTVPLFHVTGLVPVLLGSVLGGYKLVMLYKWDPARALELIERERVTTFVGVPTMAWDLLECPDFAERDTSSLQVVGGGGAPAPPELVRRIDSSFSAGRPTIGYGMTETNAYGPQNVGDDYVHKPTSAGRTVPVMEVAVLDEMGQLVPTGEVGEICFRGANLFRAYWNKPEATAEIFTDEGWMRTGDIGRLDDEGFVYVEDRAKDIVIRAGENIATTEVEATIYEHPAVYEAAVFGVPHERLGEELAAAVVVRPGLTLTEEELAAHVGEHLASFKVPTKIIFTEEQLPRGATGKILKRTLRDQVADGQH